MTDIINSAFTHIEADRFIKEAFNATADTGSDTSYDPFCNTM